MAILDCGTPNETITDRLSKKFSVRLNTLAERRQEAHVKVIDLKVQSGCVLTEAVDNPEIERYAKAHITYLKRNLEKIREDVNRSSMFRDTKESLLERASMLEFEIEIIGIPELISPQELSG